MARTSKQQKVAVIGAGIGGLAVANILAKAGYAVEVFEQNGQLGGRTGLLEVDGFRFDTGPSWYLMPEVYERYFRLVGHDITKHLTLKRLDPAYQVYFGDDPVPRLITANLTQNRKVFDEDLQPGSGQDFDDYLKRSELAYTVALQHFLYNPFISPKTVVNGSVLKHVPSLLQLTSRSLHSYVKHFFKDPRAQQLLEYPAVFLGASPYIAPALFSLMSYLDFSQGVYYPMGGMYTIVESLTTIGRQLGVTYHLNAPVQEILVKGGRTTGIRLRDDTVVEADIVVSNADLNHTETKMLAPQHQSYPEAYWKKRKAGPSAILIYFGVQGRLPQLEHHNLLFIKDWQSNFDDTFKTKVWSQPASLYVCMSSATDPSVAPKDHENLFILIPGPSGKKLSDKELDTLADQYIEQFAAAINEPDLQKRIVYQKNFGPSQFDDQYNAWEGTALGAAHTLRQSAFFRPSNRSKKVKNLYYVGAGAQPGIGVPLCLISAELVYKHIVGDSSAGPLDHITGDGND